MQQVTEDDSGKEVELKLNDTLELDLAENPTTGFRWHMTADGKPVCTITDDSYEAAKGVGKAGQHSWQFRAAKPGTGEISLVYRRGWEQDSPPTRTFTLKVRVHKAD